MFKTPLNKFSDVDAFLALPQNSKLKLGFGDLWAFADVFSRVLDGLPTRALSRRSLM